MWNCKCWRIIWITDYECLHYEFHSNYFLLWLFNWFLLQQSVECLSLQIEINIISLFILNEFNSMTLNDLFEIWNSEQILFCDFLNIFYENSHSFSIHEFISSIFQQWLKINMKVALIFSYMNIIDEWSVINESFFWNCWFIVNQEINYCLIAEIDIYLHCFHLKFN